MNIKMILSVTSLLLVMLSPILFFVYQKKKNNRKIHFWDVIAGIIVEFLFKNVSVNIITVLLTYIPFLEGVLTNIYSYLAIQFTLTALMTIVGLAIVNRLYFGNSMNADSVIGITLGMSVATILNSTLMAALSNIIYIMQTNQGVFYSNLVSQVSENQALEVIARYESFPLGYFIYVGIITIAMLASSYLSTTLFCQSTKSDSKNRLLILALVIVAYTAVYYFNNPTVMSFANPILLIFAGMQFVFAEMNNSKLIYN